MGFIWLFITKKWCEKWSMVEAISHYFLYQICYFAARLGLALGLRDCNRENRLLLSLMDLTFGIYRGWDIWNCSLIDPCGAIQVIIGYGCQIILWCESWVRFNLQNLGGSGPVVKHAS